MRRLISTECAGHSCSRWPCSSGPEPIRNLPGVMRTKFIPIEFLTIRRPPVDDFGPAAWTDPPAAASSAAACDAVASGSNARPPAVATTALTPLDAFTDNGVGDARSFDPSIPDPPAGVPIVTRASWSASSAAVFGRLSARVERHAWSTRAWLSLNPCGRNSSTHSVPTGAASAGSRLSSWNQITPTAWTSSVGAGGSFFACCGEAYSSVAAPRRARRTCSPRGPAFASSSDRPASISPHPKSLTHMVNLPPSVGWRSTFDGFRSRWTAPRACASARMATRRRTSFSAASGLAWSYRCRHSSITPARS